MPLPLDPPTQVPLIAKHPAAMLNPLAAVDVAEPVTLRAVV